MSAIFSLERPSSTPLAHRRPFIRCRFSGTTRDAWKGRRRKMHKRVADSLDPVITCTNVSAKCRRNPRSASMSASSSSKKKPNKRESREEKARKYLDLGEDTKGYSGTFRWIKATVSTSTTHINHALLSPQQDRTQPWILAPELTAYPCVFCTYPYLIVRDIIWLVHPKTSMPPLLNRQTFPRMPGPFRADHRGQAARQLCYQSSFDWGGYLEIR